MTYQLERVRLINVHNFVDETVALRDGGHLFLLGDNGSGKTTVLDAIHDVLAGGELEWNAAARLGGPRDHGRSLQGVVLRFDAERGVRRGGGAIAYAALELRDVAAGRTLTIGIGTEATTLDARVARWGFVTARPLAEVALLDDDDRPCDREALRRRLGAAAVFAPLAAFRREVAARLFGSEAAYAEAIRFWGMAKAYREIVATARDFGALFERLLPAPDGEVFAEVLRALAAIDDLDAALRDLDAQAAYVGGLVALAAEVGAAREAVARYRWLAALREVEAAAAGEAAARAAATEGAQQVDALAAAAAVARATRQRAGDALHRAESTDAAAAAVAMAGLAARRREVDADRAAAAVERDRAARDRAQCERGSAAAAAAVAGHAAAVAARLAAAVAAVGELPGDGAALGAVATALAAGDVDAVARRDRAAVDAWLTRLRGQADQRRLEAEVAVRATDAAVDAAVARRAAVPDEPDGRSAVVRAGVAALAAAGIAARPLAELLEPLPTAPPAGLAAVERLLGDELLEALVVAPDDRARAQAALVAAQAAARLVVATSASARLPAWAAWFVDGLAGTLAGRALATALAQPADVPAVELTPSWVALRGVGAVALTATPRWLGAAARAAAHAAAVAELDAEVTQAQAAQHAAANGGAAARAAQARHAELAAAVAALDGEPLVGGRAAHQRLVDRAALGRDAEAAAAARHDALAARVAELDAEHAALQARLDGAAAQELERRLVRLRRERDRADGELQAAEQALAAAQVAVVEATRRADAHHAEHRRRVAAQADALAELRAQLIALGAPQAHGDDGALATYARVAQRGDSFRSLEAIRAREAEAQRAADAGADELERDGARGVRCLAHASTFGFGYDRAGNQLTDRRGQPAAGVHAALARAIAEQRSVVNEQTRDLMDRLVLGTLAGQLQDQVQRLEDTLRGINAVLAGLRFGASRYQFKIAPRADRAALVALVGRLSILDADSRREFRGWIELHQDELRASADGRDVDAAPRLLDYRRWFDYRLHVQAATADGVELTQRLRQVGSGGEQGVPNYLLVLALAKLMFDAAGAGVRPLLFDEAFYGIDAGRRDELLRLATELGLQLVVASPDQDGVTPAVRVATTLFVIKDAAGDVHLAPYHFRNPGREPQPALFAPAGG